jgi:hypothetical protein
LLGRSYERDLREQLAAEADHITRLATTTDYARGLAAFETDDDPESEGR